MKKEKITLAAIKQDLLKNIRSMLLVRIEARLLFIIPFTLLALLLYLRTYNVYVSLAVSTFAIYNTVRFVIEYAELKKKKNAVMRIILRGGVSVSTETLSHIANEDVYEPNVRFFRKIGHWGRTRSSREITVFHFRGGSSWRVPSKLHEHYSWSNELYTTSQGLENISLMGDEFFFVKLQGYPEISYVYPCKNFDLDEYLEK